MTVDTGASGAAVLVGADLPDAARIAGDLVAQGLRDSLDRRDHATVALSGGSTPRPMLEYLATLDLDWDRVTVVQVDERVAPAGTPERNATMIEETLLRAEPSPRFLPIPVERGAAAAAHAYSRAIRRLIEHPVDVVHLGLGDDGHTASLFPGEFDPDMTDRVVATGVHDGWRRVTLGLGPLQDAHCRVVLATGRDKAQALRRAIAGDTLLPWGHLPRHRTTFVLDRDLADSVGP